MIKIEIKLIKNNMTKDELSKKFLELRTQIQNTEGCKLLGIKQNLNNSLYIFTKNHEELNETIQMFYSDQLDEWAIIKRKNYNDFLLEFQRYLHNFLSSVFSLVEHSTVFKKHLNNKTFSNFYELELKNCLLNKNINFLKNLRIYSQHYKLPFTGRGSTHFIDVEGKLKYVAKSKKMFFARLVLIKSELLKWDSWPKDAKDFILNYQFIVDSKPVSKEIIDIKDVTDSYCKSISKFYSAILKKFAELYSSQLDEYFNLSAEMEKVLMLMEKG